MATSFNVNYGDLAHILKQIRIAELHGGRNGPAVTMLQAISQIYGLSADAAALTPFGLRTVDGSDNNLLPGQNRFGAADTLFPRITDPVFQTVDGPGIDFNGDGLIDVNNHNYGDTNGSAPGGIRSVADTDPRTISNLIVSMTNDNPAAVKAWHSNPLAIEAYQAAHDGALPPPNYIPTNEELASIPNQSPDIGLSPGFNSWMTFFGQFFDHGLDLVTKGGNGTVYVPLLADDVLYDKGADGIANNVVNAYFVSDPALSPPGQLPAVSGTPTAWQAYYTTDPSLTAVGAQPPLASTTPTAWLVKINDDGAGADGIFGTGDDKPNFMALTRATVTFDANGIPQHQNTTTSFVDQNQTYTSHSSHQVFLREYVLNSAGHAVATGKLLDGKTSTGSLDGAIGNWGDVKAQAQTMLGLKMNDFNVHDAPLLKTDQYGRFIPGTNGFAEVAVSVTIVNATTGATVSTVGNAFVQGVAGGLDINALTTANLPGSFVLPPLGANQAYSVKTIGTGHAFLNDIAHHAAPGLVDHDGNPATPKIKQVADSDPGIGDDGDPLTYDDEMLNAHFITGDGRGNENIGLTTVHSIFHSEHNRLVDANKATILEAAQAGDIAFLNEWLINDVTSVPADLSTLVWDGERLFQAARFVTEMQYQHLVFEEFARRIQPNVNPFIFTNSADIDAGILAEFAHTVYRFGHSMLTNTVDRLENDLTTVNGDADQASLLEAFLNPQMYLASGTSVAAANAAIIRGTTRDVGNEIDEFIVNDLRNTLVGLPLDLAALNIARGREAGVPSLNETRRQLYEDFSVADLKPYTSWLDFARHIKTPMSVVNFIAAYGTHESITTATTNEERRDAAMKLVFGDGNNADGVTIRGTTYTNADRVAFISGKDSYTGSTATGAAGSLGGLNKVDLWIGGLAEELNEFGGMLGSTFNFIFEYQMEQLQNGDRMYYLSRTQGMNLLNQLEPNTFTDLVMRNTELGDQYSTHLNGSLFTTPDHFLELDRGIAQEDYNGALDGSDPEWDDELQQLIDPKVTRDYDGASTVVDGNGVTHDVGGTLIYSGGEHVVLGGTEGNDILRGDKGIDTLWGDGGNDYLNAGMESDNVFGGDGDDIIEDPFGDDLLRGNRGNDVISGGAGLDILFGDQGDDFIIVGQDDSEVFAGQDNDFVLGGKGSDTLLGNEGDDWIEGGDGFDGIGGENSELFFNSQIIGHDVLNGGTNDTDYDGESGDDIMIESAGIQRNNGMAGFDWAIHKGDPNAANSNLGIPVITAQPAFILRDRFDLVEGLSGWKFNDTLVGRAVPNGAIGIAGGVGAAIPGNFDSIDSFSNSLLEKNVHLIDGLDELVAHVARSTMTFNGQTETVVINTDNAEDILLGGGGSDVIAGMAGNDIISGDQWLNVRIRVKDVNGLEIGSAEGMTAKVTDLNGADMFGGRPLSALMLDRTLNPGQLEIVREILNGGQVGDVDVAVYNDNWNVNTVTRINVDTVTDGTYTITRHRDTNGNINGSYTVDHTGFNPLTAPPLADGTAPRSDGTDRLFGIERVRFANGEFALNSLVNNNPNGAPLITDLTPQEAVADLATVGSLTDPDGINMSTLTFQWQQSADNGLTWTNIAGAVGDVFTPVDLPGNSQVGDLLRVRVSYTDNGGVVETVFSGATGEVGDLWFGTAGINNLFVGTAGDDIATGVDPDGTGTGGNDFLQGNGGNDILVGLGGNDILDGGTGIDTMTGGTGNDNYNVDDDLDVVIENAGEGTDTVFTSTDTYTLLDNFENLTFNGAAGDPFVGTGNSVDNIIIGGSGADTLDGLGGNDTLDGGIGIDTTIGGLGDDIHIVRESGDIVVEAAGEGTDEVRSSANAYTLSANVENLTYTGTSNFAGTGNSQANIITGGIGNDNLSGGGTGNISDGVADTLIGGLGNDTYDVDALGEDNIVELAGEGTDTIRTSLNSFTLQDGVSIENLSFDGVGDFTGTGNNVANTITGGLGNDTLNGGLGNDSLVGGLGNDTYLVDATGDTITENAASGNDTVNSTANAYTLSANIETLNFTGIGDFTGTGNAQANTINGGTGNDTLDGAGGADTMVGGLGNDTYNVDVAGDIVTEAAGGGTDTLRTTLATYSIAALANIENLTNAGTGNFTGTGNAGDNVLTGNIGVDTLIGGNGNDTLIGGLGNDIMTGGAGDDTYSVDSTTDTVNEAAGGGTDTVNVTAATYTMSGQVEIMNFTGTGNFAGTGNAQDNIITGGSGNDNLNGGGGNDTLDGRGGNNAFTGAGGTDRVTYANATSGVIANVATGTSAGSNGFGGTDTFATIENLTGSAFNDTLTGDGAANALDGGVGIDTINGAGGADTIIGGIGNDTLNGEGGADNIDGGADNDTINGGAANDTIAGGAGNDLIIQLSTDGRDFIDGGADVDTYQLNGVAGAETFNIYTRAAFLAVAGNAAVPLNANTEIVITRNGTAAVNIIAELDNIEEIIVNTLNTTANNGNNPNAPDGGASGGDTINVFGNFAPPNTSLDYNTITINGSDATDTVNISALDSAHRIVFNTEGGNDVVIGTLRPQDVVNSPDGFVLGATSATEAAPAVPGTTSANAAPAVVAQPAQSTTATTQTVGSGSLPNQTSGAVLRQFIEEVKLNGSRGADRLVGGAGRDVLTGGKGLDTFVFGNGDRAADFKAGKDKVDLSALGITSENFSSRVSMSQQGKDVVLTIGDQTMTLSGVKMSKLMKHDSFTFATEAVDTQQSASKVGAAFSIAALDDTLAITTAAQPKVNSLQRQEAVSLADDFVLAPAMANFDASVMALSSSLPIAQPEMASKVALVVGAELVLPVVGGFLPDQMMFNFDWMKTFRDFGLPAEVAVDNKATQVKEAIVAPALELAQLEMLAPIATSFALHTDVPALVAEMATIPFIVDADFFTDDPLIGHRPDEGNPFF